MHDTKYRNRLNLNQTIEQFTSILFHMKNGYGSEEIRVSRLASHFLKKSKYVKRPVSKWIELIEV